MERLSELTLPIDKELLKKRFSMAFDTYDSNAIIQKYMARDLTQLALNYLPNTCENVLELGCGTGFLTQQFLSHFKMQHYIANDLTPAIACHLNPIFSKYDVIPEFKICDAEEIQVNLELDVVCASSVIQWFRDLDKFFKRTSQALSKDGFVVFSTFGNSTFREIRSITGNGLSYPSYDEMLSAASQLFTMLDFKEKNHTLYFDSPREVLQHIKKTGVNALSTKPWTRSDFNTFCDSYEQFKCSQGYPLTYHSYYYVFKKRH